MRACSDLDHALSCDAKEEETTDESEAEPPVTEPEIAT